MIGNFQSVVEKREAGHEFIEIPETLFLVDRRNDTPDGRAPLKLKRYFPLREQIVLLQELASLDGSPRAIESFSCRFGALTADVHGGGVYQAADPRAGNMKVKGEPLCLWTRQIALAKQAWSLWEILNDARQAGEWAPPGPDEDKPFTRLQAALYIPGPNIVGFRRDNGETEPDHIIFPMVKWHHVEEQPEAIVRRILARYFINEHLQNVHVVLSDDCKAMDIATFDLVTAIWLQFAYHLRGNLEFRRCGNDRCLRWFVPGRGGKGRTSQFFCCRGCGNNKRARERYREGKDENGKS